VEHALEIAERFKARLLLDLVYERTGRLSPAESGPELLARLQGMAADTRVVSYFMTADETILFLITRQSLKVRRVNGGEEVHRAWIEQWRSILRGTREEATDALVDLHDRLMQPVHAWLLASGARRAIFVPHRLLHNIPLHAARDPLSGRYLADDFVVQYVPALRLLQNQQRTRRERSLLAVGNPTTNLPALDAALAEAHEASELLGGTLLTHDDATVAAVVERAAEATILHFACHGIFNEIRPEQSALVLAGNELLTAAAVAALELAHVELVTMAACDSARARAAAVDEAVGLTRAWLIAGAAFILGAQWPLVDTVSRLFMRAFYRELHAGSGYADAFSAARLKLAQHPTYRDPRVWAPFTLIGSEM
jgi:CHAT domain-containing protein